MILCMGRVLIESSGNRVETIHSFNIENEKRFITSSSDLLLRGRCAPAVSRDYGEELPA